MKFRIRYTKLGNEFFFISNLTRWHFSCMEEYNKIWLEKTGPLSRKEKEALKEFKEILKKYGFRKNDKITWIGTPFVTSSETKVWKSAEGWVGEKEYKKMKKAFKIFERRFERIWTKEENKLVKTKGILERKLSSDKVEECLLDLSTFYGQRCLEETLDIYLFAVPKESAGVGGGAILGKKGLTLEIKDLESIQDYILVTLHEITHALYGESLTRKIRKETREFEFPQNGLVKEREKSGLIEELVICTLLPNGYLAEKYFGVSIERPIRIPEKTFSPSEKWSFLEKMVLSRLHFMARDYIEKEKNLDEVYIKKVIEATISSLLELKS